MTKITESLFHPEFSDQVTKSEVVIIAENMVQKYFQNQNTETKTTSTAPSSNMQNPCEVAIHSESKDK